MTDDNLIPNRMEFAEPGQQLTFCLCAVRPRRRAVRGHRAAAGAPRRALTSANGYRGSGAAGRYCTHYGRRQAPQLGYTGRREWSLPAARDIFLQDSLRRALAFRCFQYRPFLERCRRYVLLGAPRVGAEVPG